MPQLEFFAARDDQMALLAYLFSEGIRVLENASLPDSEVREFRSPAELDAAFPPGLGSPRVRPLLALWAPAAIERLAFRRIDFNSSVTWARFRYEPDSGGLMQLYLGAITSRVVEKTHFGHNSEERAGKWGVNQGVNWSELMRVSRRIQSHIRRRLAVDKVPGRPILAQAAELWRAGRLLKEQEDSPYHWEAAGLVTDE